MDVISVSNVMLGCTLFTLFLIRVLEWVTAFRNWLGKILQQPTDDITIKSSRLKLARAADASIIELEAFCGLCTHGGDKTIKM